MDTMPSMQVSEQTLRFLDVLAKLILELHEKREKGLDFILIRDIPAELLREFEENVVRLFYPSGLNQAIKDLMLKAVEETKQGKGKFN